ncbi:MAG: flippase [Candidatus Electrothrix aestuarii]|uniref:Flippase n=1 Tax=Candidatus Electrothrix aestuarii TaxID=3062594 RepID=A0AAU8M1Y3_9BACT|nr:flippase [Candidatus Electrothrix aestuarii]
MASPNPYKVIFKNTVVLTAARLFSRILQFFFFIYAARSLGPKYFGIFSFAYVLVRILEISMDMGVSRYSVQQVSRDLQKAPQYLGASLTIKIFLIISGYLLIIGTGYIMNGDALSMKVLFLLAAVAVFDNLALPFGSVFGAHQKMEYSAVIISVSNLTMCLVGFTFLYYSKDILLFCLAFVIGAFLRLSFNVFWCIKKYGMPEFNNFNRFSLWDLLKKSIPFSLMNIFVTIYYHVDSVMLQVFDGYKVVGQYNAAYRLIDAPLFISMSVTTALFPAISRLYYKKENQKLQKLISESFKKILATGLFISITAAFLADDLISIIYGEEYAAAADVLPVLIFGVACIMPGSICNTVVRASDRQSLSAIIAGGGVIFNIVLNLLLIPKYSLLGAAWATLATEMIMAGIYTVAVKEHIKLLFKLDQIIRILIFPLLLVIFLYVTQAAGVWFQLIGAGVSFFPFMLITGLITRKELTSLLERK